MISVSESARKAIKNFLQERNLDSALRVHLQGGCCGGPSLRLGLDEARAGDLKFELDGLTYLISEELSRKSGDVTVDYVDNGWQQGFSLSSQHPLGEGGTCGGEGGCGGSCSC